MGRSFWKVWGKFYGYPQCCMDEMAHFYVTNPNDYYGQSVANTRKLSGTGFIPCSKCTNLKLRHLVGIINSKRISSKEFPYEQSFEAEITELLQSDKIKAFEKKLIINQYRD